MQFEAVHFRRFRSDYGNHGGRMPPEFAHETPKPVNSARVLTHMERGILAHRVRFSGLRELYGSAPIGALVFTTERRNHSKTRVYELACVRVAVDTTCPADKLKKSKNGFKFERFDVFSQTMRALQGRQASAHRARRGAARMGGLPFDSRRSNRSQRSRRSGSRTSHNDLPLALVASPAAFMPLSHNPELPDNKHFFCLPEVEAEACPGSQWKSVEPRLATLMQHRDRPHGPACEPVGRGLSLGCREMPSTRAGSRAAQPLQYGFAEGWDDCSIPQKTAGRGKEETGQ